MTHIINVPGAPWVAVAAKYIGTHEMLGGKANPLIHQFFQSTGFKAGDAQDPWCAAFVGHVLKECGIAPSGKAAARSYENFGHRLDKFLPGCIGVFTRPGKPGNGHVAFCLSEEPSWVTCLGGNQDSQVKVKPYAKSRLLTYRWPLPIEP